MGKQLNIYLSEEVYDLLVEVANRNLANPAEYVRQLIKDNIVKDKKKK